MKIQHACLGVLGVAVLLSAVPAYGQLGPNTPTAFTTAGFAFENVESAGARSPGLLVQRGLVQATSIDAFIIPEITEEPRESIRGGALAEAITVVFEQLNTALDLLGNLFLVRAGGEPDLSRLLDSAGLTKQVDHSRTARLSRNR